MIKHRPTKIATCEGWWCVTHVTGASVSDVSSNSHPDTTSYELLSPFDIWIEKPRLQQVRSQLRSFPKSEAELALKPNFLTEALLCHVASWSQAGKGWPSAESYVVPFSEWPRWKGSPWLALPVDFTERGTRIYHFSLCSAKVMVEQFSTWKWKSSNFKPAREKT